MNAKATATATASTTTTIQHQMQLKWLLHSATVWKLYLQNFEKKKENRKHINFWSACNQKAAMESSANEKKEQGGGSREAMKNK